MGLKASQRLNAAQRLFAADMAAAGYTAANIALCTGYGVSAINVMNTSKVMQEARLRRQENLQANKPVLPEIRRSVRNNLQTLTAAQLKELREQLARLAPDTPQASDPPATPTEAMNEEMPANALLALPLIAASENPLARKGLALPYGLTADLLWHGFIAHNRAVYDAYRAAAPTDPLTDCMMMRFSIQRLKPQTIAEADRDDFIRTKKREHFPGLVREAFLLVTQPVAAAHIPSRLVGELWIDQYANTEKGTRYQVVMTERTGKAPDPHDVFVQLAGRPQPEKLIKPAPKIALEAA